jgi:hypothetical protein
MKTQYLKILEKYFNREMNSEEVSEFEKMLEKDRQLQSAYREYLLIMDSLQDNELLDFRSKLKEIRDEHYRKRIGGYFLNQNFNWMWMAALLIVIICMTVVTTMIISRLDTPAPVLASESKPVLSDLSLLEIELGRFIPRNLNFILQTPKDSSIVDYHGSLWFSWQVDSVSALNFELISRNGTIVFDSRGPVKSPYHFARPMKEGLYVFRFRDHQYSIFHGVIYLK